MRPDFLPGDGTLDAIRAEHEAEKTKPSSRVNPYMHARIGFLLAEYDRRTAELLSANTAEVERRRVAEAIVRDLAEWHSRSEASDGDDFLNGDGDDGRCGHDEIAALGRRATALIVPNNAPAPPVRGGGE